jgi:SulP family sulfate permease
MQTQAVGVTQTGQQPSSPSWQSTLPRSFLYAFIVALISISYAVSYGAMIFGGDSHLLAAGMPLMLLSTFTMLLLVACTSSLPFMVGGPDSNSVGVLALMVTGMTAEMHRTGSSPEQIVSTVLVAIAASSVIAGICIASLGAMRRGSLVQFIPFPVVGGFLAGSGFLLVGGAFDIVTGHPLGLSAWPALQHISWHFLVPMLMVAGVMLAASSMKWTHPALLICTLLAAGLVFFGGLSLDGISIDQARSMGWLFQPFPAGGLRLPVSLSWGEVRWSTILSHYSELLAMITIVTLTILLNATGVGLATRRDVDFNHELRSAGIANIISGVLGGSVGSQSLSRTLLNFQTGSRGRTTCVIAAILCLLCTFFFVGSVALIPKPLLAGLLTGLGCQLLNQWAIKARSFLSTPDYLLILAILAVIATTGFVTGVAAGIVVACVLFVVDYGRVSCIKMEFTGAGLTSRLERGIDVGSLLKEQGDSVFGVCLQGYLFFGSANQMVNRVRERLQSPRKFVVIDFQRVQGMDASTSQSFAKLRQLCEQHDVMLVLTGIPENARLPLTRALGSGDAVREFETLDSALEWIENMQLLALSSAQGAPDWRRSLVEHFGLPQWQRLFARTESQDLDVGELLFGKDDAGDCMYFIESGQVSISVPLDGGKTVRLRAFGSGTIIGEMALYTGHSRTADVRADSPARVHKLSLHQLRALEREEPATAMQLHTYVVTMLATRLAAANEAYRLAF